MKQSVKLILAIATFVALFICVNLLSARYLFLKQEDNVRTVVTSYVENVIAGNYNLAYGYFSENMKARYPEQQFVDNVKYSLQSSGNFEDYKIVSITIGTHFSTNYIGPKATVRVKVAQLSGNSINEFILFQSDSLWKIEQLQSYRIQE